MGVHNIRVVRRSLTTDTAHSLIRALVHGRLDYCNGTLAGLPQYQLNKLQTSIHPPCLSQTCSATTWTSQRLQSDECSAPHGFLSHKESNLNCAVLFTNVSTMLHQHTCPSSVSRFPLKRAILSFVLQLPEIFSFHLPELLQSEARVFP